MRKIAGILVLVFILFAAFMCGRMSGIQHAIRDSRIWAVECYDPDDAEIGEFDQTIYIELDGEVYVHGLYIG